VVKVLFVCLGNICRSPMAEGVFRHLVKEAGLQEQIQADSAGLGAWHVGEPPHAGTRKTLRAKGIDARGLIARVVTAEDLLEFDYVIAMDRENAAELEPLQSRTRPQAIHLLMEFAPDARRKEVPDPYYTGNFTEAYTLVEAGCRGLLAHIRAAHSL
jgi:protein-tyrosine phosphatase